MERKTVLYESHGGVATVTMNRPESLNALDATMGAELAEALGQAAGDGGVRAVVLTGAGRAFCAGGDLKAMAAGLLGDDRASGLAAILRNFHRLILALYELELPIVAAIHGPAVGAGMSLALACDFRIAAEDATFSQAFVRLGLTPDGGSSWLLPRVVGATRAAQLMMTGETLDARRALEWGFLNGVTPGGQHLAEAEALARRLASFSPHALRGLKRLLRSSETNSFAQQLEAEAAAQQANSQTEEFRAAIAAFLARNKS